MFSQLETLDRTEEAFELLKNRLAKQPEDADLVLFASDTFLRYGRVSTAHALLKHASITTKQASWLRAQANLARETGDPEQALRLAQEANSLEPLNLGIYRLIASLKAQVHGRSEAIAYLQNACQRFTHYCGLHELLIDWMSNEAPEKIEPYIRHLIAINANNLWAQRELAGNLTRQRRYQEAHEVVALTLQMAPTIHTNYSIAGYVCLREGDVPRARDFFRQALSYSIDNDYALSTLVSTYNHLEERKESLAFIRTELVRQITSGDALLTFQEDATNTLAPDELTALLQDALKERPDLWQAWVALGMQLMNTGKLLEAIEILEKAEQKFPFVARVYVEIARAQLLSGKRAPGLETLKSALRISPSWVYAVRTYVNAITDEGIGLERALTVLDTALARSPEDADLRALRANCLSLMKRPDEALMEVKRAIAINSSLNWPWNLLRRFAPDDVDCVERVATELSASHPGDHWSWIRLAEAAKDFDIALAAIEKAIVLDPRNQRAFETKLDLLLKAKRYSALNDALNNMPWTDYVPATVRVFTARLDRAQSNVDAATKTMRQLLEQDPNNYGFWSEYADWCDEANNIKEYLEAAENMLRLNQNYYVAHGYYADALCKSNAAEKAKPHFERAWELDPSYAFAGFNLLDTALDDKDITRASELIEKLRVQNDSPALKVRQIRLAALTKNLDLAVATATEILAHKDNSEWACKSMIEHMSKANWKAQLAEVIKNAIATGQCEPVACEFLIDQQGKGAFANVYSDMRKIFPIDTAHILKIAFLSWLVKKDDSNVLNRFVNDYKTILNEHLLCWCQVGYAYVSTDQHNMTVNWMKHWRQRSDVPSWALDNLALALRYLSRHAEAKLVSQRSLELEPSNLDAKIWLAFDAACDGRMADVRSFIHEIDRNNVRPFFQKILDVICCFEEAHVRGDATLALKQFRRIRREGDPSKVALIVMEALSARLTVEIAWWKKMVYLVRFQ